jgi:hypothetical protein
LGTSWDILGFDLAGDKKLIIVLEALLQCTSFILTWWMKNLQCHSMPFADCGGPIDPMCGERWYRRCPFSASRFHHRLCSIFFFVAFCVDRSKVLVSIARESTRSRSYSKTAHSRPEEIAHFIAINNIFFLTVLLVVVTFFKAKSKSPWLFGCP